MTTRTGHPLWTLATGNAKTGKVPTLWIGRTRAETVASCSGCPLLPARLGGPAAQGTRTCYAYDSMIGTGGLASLQKAVARGLDRSLSAMLSRLRTMRTRPRLARLGAIGEPSAVPHLRHHARDESAHGARVVGYTHQWHRARNRHLRDTLMASCDTPAQTATAIAAGFRPAVIIPANHPGPFFRTDRSGRPRVNGTRRFLVCPAQRKPGRVTCETCGLCDPQHPAYRARRAIAGIALLDHSPAARARLRRTLEA